MKKYKFLGNFSAVDPVYSRQMCCHDCEVEWVGCWDNFMCPICGEGDLPSRDTDILFNLNLYKKGTLQAL